MNTTHWEIAALANTMAMKTTVTLDPTLITPRIKNSIKRQLRAGVITGGYRSEAAKIGEQIVKKWNLAVTRKQWRGMQVGSISMEQKRRIAEIYRADWTACTLERPVYANSKYYKDRYAEAMDNLSRRGSRDFFLDFHGPQFSDQAYAVLAESITSEQWREIDQAIAMLDSNEPIHITTY